METKSSQQRTQSSGESLSDEPSQPLEYSQPAVQINNDQIQQAVKLHKERSQARRAEREQAIRAERKKNLARIAKRKTECERKYEENRISNLRPKLDRLRELLQRKSDLESEIEESFGQIDQAMRSTVAQAKVAVAVRMEELTLKEATPRGS
ncbi:hypothetical protein TI39_contig1089g00002 [Zymoseptoria brevis]|uniref:Uncharacterized protein n=1 Tax=Zymoseptoria brevis TaxID=1047168 RepID=A0A0F4GFG6_9PEZI|nr:hypothetical protein TI39_contig1089g00002 [Zymoseptoria brevis]